MAGFGLWSDLLRLRRSMANTKAEIQSDWTDSHQNVILECRHHRPPLDEIPHLVLAPCPTFTLLLAVGERLAFYIMHIESNQKKRYQEIHLPPPRAPFLLLLLPRISLPRRAIRPACEAAPDPPWYTTRPRLISTRSLSHPGVEDQSYDQAVQPDDLAIVPQKQYRKLRRVNSPLSCAEKRCKRLTRK